MTEPDSNHDLLLRLDERQESLERWMEALDKRFANHLRHHVLFSIAGFSAAAVAFVALLVVLLT